jgi:hypothetical protein
MRYTIRAVLLAAAVAAAVPAQAADFSFSGMFTGDDDVAFFDFTATDASTITLRSYSYAAPFCDVTGAKRTGNWAFDVLGVNAATGPDTPAVPEPATWAMMLLGFGMVAGVARYRRRTATVSFA